MAQVTPAGWLAAQLGLVALVLGSAAVTLVAQLVRRWMDQHQRGAELDWCADVRADRAPVSPRTVEVDVARPKAATEA